MPELVGQVLLLFLLFQIKHLLADFFFQTPRMLTGRSTYWHVGRAQHAAVHAAGSVLCFLIVGANAGFIAAIVLAEWVIHFNIDWGKAHYTEANRLDPSQARFWHATGVDQALHQLTYIAMVWAWVVFAAS